MVACNKGMHCHPATHPLAFLVGNATKRNMFDIIHTHTFRASQDVRLFIAVIGMDGTGDLINMIWRLFTDRAAAAAAPALKVTAPTRIQVAAANIYHGQRCGRHTVYSTRPEVGHFTVVDVKISNTSRNSVQRNACLLLENGTTALPAFYATCDQTKSP